MPQSNPFCTRFIQPGAVPFEFGQVSAGHDQHASGYIDAIIDDLKQSRWGAVIGPHGTGKSTLIQTLRPALARRFDEITQLHLQAAQSSQRWRRFCHRRDNGKRVRQIAEESSAGSLIIVDGIEQLASIDRLWLRRHASRKNKWVLATSHRRLAGFANLYTTTVDRPLVEYLCHRLLQHAPDRTVRVVNDALQQVDIDDRTDVRSLWFNLYDVVATQP